MLCAASLLVVLADELCASAGFAGVAACAIRCGVVALSLSEAFGVALLSGVVVLLGVAELSGVVVVVVVDFVVVLEPAASVAGFAQGWFAWSLAAPVAFGAAGVVLAAPVASVDVPPTAVEEPVALLGVALSWVLDGVAGVAVVVVVCFVVVVVLVGLWLFTSELLVLWEPMLLAPV